MVAVAEQVRVSAAILPEAGNAPLIIERRDQDFLQAMFSELQTEERADRVRATRAKTKDENNVLRLYQPVHRIFHIVAVQVSCDRPGHPRLDPAKIDSAGVVLRRIPEGNEPPARQGWMHAGKSIRGWRPITDEEADPDFERRPRRLRSGHRIIDDRLALTQGTPEPVSEAYAPLFVAPPDVCASAKATVLYGMVPLTSSEKVESGTTMPGFNPDDVGKLLPPHLKSGLAASLPRTSTTLSPSDAAAPDLLQFIQMVRSLAIQLDLFGESPDSQALFAAVNEITLDPFVLTLGLGASLRSGFDLAGPALEVFGPGSQKAGDFLRDAFNALVLKNSGASVRMPGRWPVVANDLALRIKALATTVLNRQIAAITSQEGRFDELRRRYVMSAFVRVKRDDGCPPALFWSGETEPFTIAAWYDASDMPPIQINLPDLSNRDALKKLKPNVAFSMPEDLLNTIEGADLDDPSKKGGFGLGLGWICGFNIPIITLCAFIVLNIFLKLFDLIFQWMFFIKICIPIPVPRKR